MRRAGRLSVAYSIGIGLVCAAIVGVTASSAGAPPANGGADVRALTTKVESLQKEVRELRAKLDDQLARERYTPKEIGYLEEIVAAWDASHKKALTLSGIATAGGEVEVVAAAARQLALAKARLAWARGQLDQFDQASKDAVAAAELEVQALESAFAAQTVTVDALLGAKARRAETQLELSRLRKGLVSEGSKSEPSQDR